MVQCTREIDPSHIGPVNLPISVPHLSVFIAYLHTQGYSPASIIAHSSSIGYLHRLLGFSNPMLSTLIQKLLSGVTRVTPPSPPRLPITIGILAQLIYAVDHLVPQYYHKYLIRAMLTVGFFGLMRIGELTKSKEGLVPLNLNQLTITPHLILINITHFKHNQNLRPVEVPIQPQTFRDICPVHHLTQYLQIRGNQPGPLFSFPTLKPIPRQFFSSRLAKLIRFAGFQTERYKSHSLRIGGASYYASLGYSDNQIRLLGRWDSNAFIKYIRSSRAITTNH